VAGGHAKRSNEAERLRREAEEVPLWDRFTVELESLRLPDMKGKSVLDVGTRDGLYAFDAERRGASRVLALDQHTWSIDPPALDAYLDRCRAGEERLRSLASVPQVWRPGELPGERDFEAARDSAGSGAEALAGDLMELGPAELGTFDVVLYLDVLERAKSPLAALRGVAAVTGEVAVVSTRAVAVAGVDGAVCRFVGSHVLNPHSPEKLHWWEPNEAAIEAMCRAAGFSRIEVIVGAPAPASESAAPISYGSLVHAWK